MNFIHPALFKYYFDITRYNLAISAIIGFVKFSPFVAIISFATFSMPISIYCFRYFQNNQYYFYYNVGITKKRLVAFAWIINFLVAAILLLFIY